ncbi:MAG: serine/threonine protein kinase [Phycisphaeraceae bacterium]|nr:MAG: serine/threonine protein kinase [Phycisphaeraceae bacterium]
MAAPPPDVSEPDMLVTAPLASGPGKAATLTGGSHGAHHAPTHPHGTEIFGSGPDPAAEHGGLGAPAVQSLAMAGVAGGGPVGRTPPRPAPNATGGVNKLMLSTGVLDLGRFVPGTLLGQRYRIVGRLGKGGMGEVYRADDLKLGQPVAMKFLPEELAQDEAALSRLVHEVKIARQVSHPNVCRVYDIGDIEGVHFISMEYVDGEDLSTLLRRIGRLPVDKAVQLARQMCAGLMAAHERGVLHRDLKPANIMIDGKGQVRLMDFGLAGLAEELKAAGSRAGTPAYMSPEQLSGTGVTAQSDVYSLGLVLYELFTGKPVYRPQSMAELIELHNSLPSSMRESVAEVPDAVDKVVLRCLSKDAALRPPSALALATALGGADALSAALAAGEIPSPELVAASGGRGALDPVKAGAALGAVVVGVALVAGLNAKVRLIERDAIESPVVLAADAQRLLTAVGAPPAADRAYGWTERRREGSSPHAEMMFWHRTEPAAILPERHDVRVGPEHPPLGSTGSTLLIFDRAGRLTEFRAEPSDLPPLAGDAARDPWAPVFERAAVPQEPGATAEPRRVPPVAHDRSLAWAWTTADGSRIVAHGATLAGRPVYFHAEPQAAPTSEPADEPVGAPGSGGEGSSDAARFVTGLVLYGLLILGPAALAFVNVRRGRGDPKGASRLAGFVLASSLVAWLLSARVVASASFLDLIPGAIGGALYAAVLAWVVYMAVEPLVRQVWPQSLISLSRLLSGDVRDGLVGRDVLAGCGLGVGWTLLVQGLYLLPVGEPPAPRPVDGQTLGGVREALGAAVGSANQAVLLTLVMLFLVPLARFVVRARAAADLAVGALVALGFLALLVKQTGHASPAGQGVLAVVAVVVAGATVFILARLGALMFMAAFFAAGLLDRFPLTLDTSAWYFGSGLVAAVAVAGLAAWGFRRTIAGQPKPAW